MDLFKNVNLKLLKHGANHYTSIINNKQYGVEILLHEKGVFRVN